MRNSVITKYLPASLYCLFGLLTMLTVLASPASVRAAETNITTGSDWQSGVLEGVEATSTEGEIKLNPTGSWGAQSWKTPDKTIGIGSAFANDGERLYVFRGYGDVAFWRYTPTTDSWETLPNAPRGVYYGADLQYHDGNIYALFGGYQKAFARYSIANNTWEMMPDFPSFVWQGGAMTSDGTYLYGIPGNTTQEFYRFNFGSNSWSSLTQAPNTLRSGADLVHINGYIYTPRGIATNTFYRYSISENNWVTLTNLPTTLNDDIDTTSDGIDLYVSRQQGTNSFYRYNVASDTWDSLTNAPYTAQYAGVQYLDSDGMIYFFRGLNDMRFWKYDPNKAVVSVTRVQSDGKILIGGSFTTYNGTSRVNLARLESNGSVDTSFDPGTGPNGAVSTMVIQTDGKIIIGGSFSTYNGTARNRIARLNTDGTLDTSFDPGTGPDGYLQSLALQTDGKIVIGGSFTSYNGTDRNRIARLESNGSLDATFNPGTGANDVVNAVAVQTDGKIVIGGAFSTYAGTARSRIARLTSTGSLEAVGTFNPGAGANDAVQTLALQTDGKIVIGGSFTTYAGTARARVARVNTNGTNDTTFVPGAAANDTVHSLAIQSDGKIVIRGYFTTYTGTLRNRIARLTSSGGLDTAFDPGVGVNNTIHTLAVQSDGTVLIGGSFTTVSATARNRIARLTTTGALDSGFTVGTGIDVANGTTKDKFIGPTEAPLTLSTGSDMVYYNGEFYIPRGTNTTTFYKYTPATNTWTTLTPTPQPFNDDVRGTVANGLIYFFRGSSTAAFYSYDPIANSWDTTLSGAPATVSYGGNLHYPGTGDYIYATRGINTGTFWRYTISTDTWEPSVGGLPIQNLPAEVVVGYGSRLVGSGNDIYLNTGSGTKRFFKYSISDNTWTEQAALPFSPLWGTDLVYANGVITAMAGYYENDMYEYSPTTSAWRKLKSLPGYGPTDYGPYSGAAIAHDPGTNSFFVTRAGGRQEVLVYSPGLTNFEATGTWTSAPIDVQHVGSWTSLAADTTTPGDSVVSFATRTSSDASSWSGWQTVSGGVIASPAARYVQIKATLQASSTLAQTPVVRAITLDYSTDVTAPNNPTTFSGSSSQVGGDPLTSGVAYRHLAPYFTWSGATDDQTSIAGYYVYFGSSGSADPVAEGTFQTTTAYQSNAALETGTYHLRVATKNTVGLTSAPITGFVYEYTGISPALELAQTLSADFSGTATQTVTTGDKIELESLGAGFWTNERLALANTGIQWGGTTAAYVASENKIFVSPGANTLLFRAYNLTTNAWENLPDTPAAVSYGGGVVAGPPGYLYVLRGGLFTDFWIYDYAGENPGTWNTAITAAPLTVGYGASMIYDGEQYIYVTRGNSTNTFWRYDTVTDGWSNLDGVEFGAPSSMISNNIHRSADLAFDPVHNLIYATQGNYMQGFSVYDINTGHWTVLPDTPTLTYDGSALEFNPATNQVYFTAGNATDYFYAYDVASQEWEQLNSAPATLQYGAGLNKVGEYLYVFRGGNTTNFYKYDIAKNTWLLPSRGLFSRVFDGVIGTQGTINTGADILKGDGHNFYLTRGNYADDFLRWNEETGEVTQLANTPNGVFTGSSMVYDGNANQIYFTAGTTDRNFFSYDIATNVWTKITSDPLPIVANTGSSMVYDGARYIYLNRGGNTANFYQYDQQANPGFRWTSLTNVTAAVSNGAELLLKNGLIYTMRGGSNANNALYRFTPGGLGSWAAMTPLSTTVGTDGFFVDGNDGYFYLGRALNTTDFFRYSVSGNAWEQLSAMPAQPTTGAAAESNLLNKIYMLPGPGTDTYSDALHTYVLNTATSGFVESGTYTTPSHDLTTVYRWANLEVTQSVPDNTELLIETRSSLNNATWTEWVATSQAKTVGAITRYKINSTTGRYVQVRFTLHSPDKVATPVVSDYTVNYYSDSSAPTNPQTAGLTAFSQESGGAPILSDTWYNHPAPYFVWPEAEATNGASDTATGSGVLGYHVYFGPTADADPFIEGTYQTENTYIPSTVAASTTNYLRIKTVDEAGNVAGTTWEPFRYKYDADAPPAPTNLAADPAGYSSTDSFNFSWDQVLEGSEPVAAYCYKTGATSGPFATDQCTTELSVAAVPSHQVGTNTFSVRAKDQSGNYSPYASVSYYYADIANAPAPPANLTLTTPATNSVNSFGFAWDVPSAFLGSAVNLSYRFSVNAIPTAQSTTATSLRYLNPGAYATLPGENVFYIVAQDEAGNINYSNYAQISFFANTVAPGIPVDMEIADVSVKNTASWRLTLSWDAPEASGSGVAEYAVYRSTDGTTYSQVSTTSSESYVDTKLTQVTYYYKVKACDDTNNCGEFSSVVELLPDGRYTSAAELIAEPVVSAVTTHKATISWSTGRTSDSKIAYGTGSNDYFDEEVASSDPVTSHVLTLNNLAPGTTYYFTAKWTDEDGNTGTAEEQSFSTLPPPSTEEPVAKNVGLTSAQIEFVTRNASKVKLYYGETSAFGGVKEIVTSTTESTQLIELTDLKDATKYYYKINTLDIDGTEYEGEIHSFETLPRPLIDDVIIQQIQGTAKSTLLVRWTSNTAISSIVTYYPSATPSMAIDEVNIALTAGSHQMILFNLTPQTPYSVIIRGKDLAGNEAISEVQQVLTSADTRPPQVTDLKVESEIIGTGEEATAQMIVSYKTDEPASSQVEYGEGTGTVYSQKTQESSALTDNHLVIISGLAPGKVYHLRSLSKDGAGNLAESIDKVVVTPKATENALDLVVSNLTGAFSFLR